MGSAAWAGTRGAKQPVRITLGASFMMTTTPSQDEDALYSYEVALGLGPGDTAAFNREPQVKDETLTFTSDGGRPVKMLERRGPVSSRATRTVAESTSASR